MSALEEVDVSLLVPAKSHSVIKNIIGALFWKWYKENENIVAFRYHVVGDLITKSFKLKDFKETFELIFGPEPNASQ